MKQYINKDALVAEIEKRRKEAELNCGGYKSYDEHRCDDCTVDFYNEFLEIVNTLEVEESLTWKDIRELYIIFAEVDTEIEFCKTDIQVETIGYYQEVLKRFKHRKENKL